MPRKRKADVAAGSHGSLANRLMLRRKAMEMGMPGAATKVMTPGRKPTKRKTKR